MCCLCFSVATAFVQEQHPFSCKSRIPIHNPKRLQLLYTSLEDDDVSERSQSSDGNPPDKDKATSEEQQQHLLNRITQLEKLVAAQQVQIRHLHDKIQDWTAAAEKFHEIVHLLNNDSQQKTTETTPIPQQKTSGLLFEETNIFSTAPATVMEAADSAGSSILAALLAGKRRMLVDVRDAELTFSKQNEETLTQFIELAILPVAAGLEGLQNERNRLKIVFPTVSQLLTYRKCMALAAPEVVALSTLGLDPVETRDNLVVVLVPSEEQGLSAMNQLLQSPTLTQPVIVVNHHMTPVTGPAAEYEVAYQLRLLNVQYMAGDIPPEFSSSSNNNTTKDELESALEHAHTVGNIQHGETRAMVIRGFPQPWHIFVDISPDSDTDYVVAATHVEEPTNSQIQTSIVECLEGSEQEDEIVAQQMQQALELGQLDRISDLLGTMGLEEDLGDDEEEDDDDDIYGDLFGEDTV